jgi:DHA1 family bicyclomycin/chloramphenicol resistance-like MFS transporter
VPEQTFGRQPGPFVPFVLAACTAVSVLSTDLVAPSIPDLPAIFGSDIVTAQMTVSINLAAYALAQLVHGPLADNLGRRRLLTTAFAFFAVFSVFCALASSMDMLLAGRFLQGLCSSVPSVVIILIIRELYDGQDTVRVMGLYGATLGIAPAVGPLLGGYLHVWFGWSAGFWTIAALTLIVLGLFAAMIPETLRNPQPLRFGAAAAGYRALLRRPDYLRTAIALSLVFGALYAFVATGPVIFIDLLGMPTQRYGLTYIFVIAAFVLGNVVTSRLSGRLTALQLVRAGALGALLAGLALAGPSLAGINSILLILAAMSFYALGLGAVLAAGPIVLLDTVRDLPQGSASALLGSLQLGAAALAGYLSASFYDDSALSMSLTIAGFALAGALAIMVPHQVTAAE